MAEQYLPDTFGAMTNAFNAGRLLKAQKAAAQQKQQLAALAPQVLQGDPNATAQAYAIDPDTAKAYGDGAARMGLQLHNIANQLKQFHQQGNEQAAAMLYQQAAPMIRQKFPNAPAQWDPNALMPAIDAVVAMTAGDGAQKGMPNSFEEYQLAQQNPEYGKFLAGQQPTQMVSLKVPGGTLQAQWNPRTHALVDMQGNSINPDGSPMQGQAPSSAQQPPAQDPGAGLNDPLSQAVMQQESGGNPNAVSPAGAQGLMQIMPATAKDPGFGIAPMRDGSPQENVRVGQDYLHAMLQKYNGDQQLALAAYNGGPGRVDQALQQAGGDKQRAMSLLPKETQQYPGAVQGRMGGQQPSPMAGRIGFTPDKAPARSSLQERLDIAKSMGATKEQLDAIVLGGASGQGSAPVPGDPSKSGEEYLATLPPEMRNVVKAIANGDQPPPSSSSRSPQAQALLQAVYAYDPKANATNLPARTQTRKDFTSGKSAQNLRSLNQAIGHLGLLESQIGGTAAHGGFPFAQTVNKAENAYNRQHGDSGITNYEQTAAALASELTQVFRGNGGAEADINRNLAELSSAQSEEQKKAAVKNVVGLLQSRIEELGQQYSQGMGRTVDPFSLINPHAADVLKRITGGASTQPAAPHAPAPGTIEDGHRFKGGNPADPANWEAVR